ncbi:MAG: methyltransferase domain-containing protein [Methylococcaceae bacterium]|nr:methyltransferase domain-containing protein [Methylococcaceae bacterium]
MQKHFESDYNKLVQKNLANTDKHSAMAQSIGGNFIPFGIFQRELLLQHGLKANDTVLDVGCGAGRLANALKEMPQLSYIGIDVVQELLDYAQELCNRPDWTFIKAADFTIPLENNSVDMVTAFSVFTHLLHEESYAYLAEFRRVLKPGGKIVFTFLDFNIPEHRPVFASNLTQISDRVHLNQFIDPQAIQVWSQHLQLDVEGIFHGNQPHIQLNETVKAEDGTFHRGKVALGQSICVLQKPCNATNIVLAVLPKDFLPEKYLELNPDLAALTMGLGSHYLAHGQFENRRFK